MRKHADNGQSVNEDFLAFLALLNQHHGAYMVVVGFAVNGNGYQRTTDDVDIWVERSSVKHFVAMSLPRDIAFVWLLATYAHCMFHNAQRSL